MLEMGTSTFHSMKPKLRFQFVKSQKLEMEMPWAFYFTEICKKSKSPVFILYEKPKARNANADS